MTECQLRKMRVVGLFACHQSHAVVRSRRDRSNKILRCRNESYVRLLLGREVPRPADGGSITLLLGPTSDPIGSPKRLVSTFVN